MSWQSCVFINKSNHNWELRSVRQRPLLTQFYRCGVCQLQRDILLVTTFSVLIIQISFDKMRSVFWQPRKYKIYLFFFSSVETMRWILIYYLLYWAWCIYIASCCELTLSTLVPNTVHHSELFSLSADRCSDMQDINTFTKMPLPSQSRWQLSQADQTGW